MTRVFRKDRETFSADTLEETDARGENSSNAGLGYRQRYPSAPGSRFSGTPERAWVSRLHRGLGTIFLLWNADATRPLHGEGAAVAGPYQTRLVFQAH